MELDGFSTRLSIAFEHQGEHHFVHSPHFQRRNESLSQRKLDDNTKRILCAQNSVHLIEVPYSVPERELPQWIFERLSRVVQLTKLNNNETQQTLSYVPSVELNELRELAQKRGGECLSNVYAGVLAKHGFRCRLGHEWEAIPSNVKGGSWCPVCKRARIGDSNRKHTWESMQQLAASRRGEFLAVEFKSVNSKYPWRCAAGHEWEAAPADVSRGSWCPTCAREAKKDSIADMHAIARARGGWCLSDRYINQSTKLRWRCGLDHEWDASPSNVKGSRSWCPQCVMLSRRKTK